MSFRERLQLEKKYRQWIKDKNWQDRPMSMIVFLELEGFTKVVRCKDCAHWWDAIHTNTMLMGKRWQYCQKQKEMRPEDGYCWMGERKDEVKENDHNTGKI